METGRQTTAAANRAIKAAAICGSPRQGGSTETLLRRAMERLTKLGVAVELTSLRWKTIVPCTGCGACRSMRNGACALEDDFAVVFRALREADVLLFGAPAREHDFAPEFAALLDRAGKVSRANGGVFARKVCGVLAAEGRTRRGSGLQALLGWAYAQETVLAGAWFEGDRRGRVTGLMRADEGGFAEAERLADLMAWLAARTTADKS